MDNGSLSVMIRALDSFPVSVEDIVRTGLPELLRDARDYLRTTIPGSRTDEFEQMLWELLLSRCVSEVSACGEWVRYPVGTHPELAFRILGLTLSGNAVITPKRIRVELSTGQGILFRESLLHDWAPAIYTKDPVEGSPANREGESRTARLFLELCVQHLGKSCNGDSVS